MHRARTLCDHDSLHSELEFLKATLRHNGYNSQQIHWVLEELVDTVTNRDPKLCL
jgi:hypothetical protein